MTNKLEYINEEAGDIIIRKFNGEVSFPEILDSWNYLINNNLICENCVGIINDFREAKLKMQLENLEKLFEFFKKHYNIFNKIKLAVLMNRPEDTVLPIFAKKEYPQFQIEAFSTFEAAKHWVLQKNF